MSQSLSDPDTTVLQRREASLLSPLRYPGGKKRLAGYIAEALRLNGLHPRLFVEPFAGGASVALQLLNDGLVDQIALGEKDPLVASFWKVVFGEPEWLIQQIQSIEPNLETWQRFRQNLPEDDYERALVCLFLNRTSFSGILNDSAGPIGGQAQTSPYKIDCRYAPETIIRRIRQIARLAGRVLFVREGDWTAVVKEVESLDYQKDEIFYYFDPPFYYKADRLYRYYFEERDHQRLHDELGKLQGNYILSYDVAEPILRLYEGNGIGPKRVEVLYSATQPGELIKAQELIISNLSLLPQATRLWRTTDEWKKS